LDEASRPPRVVACGPAARLAGVAVDMPRRRAMALCPSGAFLPHNPEAVREAWEGVLATLRGFTPRLESLEPGLALLDLGAW
jgi:nucleotidyltransferase/DNA polymerase involved in DNA repair